MDEAPQYICFNCADVITLGPEDKIMCRLCQNRILIKKRRRNLIKLKAR